MHARPLTNELAEILPQLCSKVCTITNLRFSRNLQTKPLSFIGGLDYKQYMIIIAGSKPMKEGGARANVLGVPRRTW